MILSFYFDLLLQVLFFNLSFIFGLFLNRNVVLGIRGRNCGIIFLVVKRHDIISYKFSRTSIDNLLTEVELKYNYDRGLGQYLKSVKTEVDENYFYCGTQASVEKKNYYGLREKSDGSVDHLHTNKVYESE